MMFMQKDYSPIEKVSTTLLAGKKLLCIACFGMIILSSCSKYQYISINSNLTQNDKREFISENDTVKVTYTFQGEACPMKVEIYNKLQKPLYIDWSKSYLIIDTDRVNNPFNHEGTFSYIDPHSDIVLSGILVQNRFIPTCRHDSLATVTISTKNGTTEVIRHSYTPETTPLYLRCCLSISTNEDALVPVHIDDQFWVSDIKKSLTPPTSLPYSTSNEFYVRKTTAYGKFMIVFGVVLSSVARYY